jgi:hypothetical protein
VTGSKGTKAKCGANKTNGKGTCTREAGWGTPHLGFGQCRIHGGNTPSGLKFAARLMGEVRSMQFGGPRIVDPHQVLLEEVYRSAGHVEFLHQKVLELTDDDLSEVNIGGKVPAFWIRWYTDERMRLVNSAAVCIKAGVAERQVRVAEEQGRIFAGAIRLILTQLGLTPEQERKAPGVIRKVLEALPVGAPTGETIDANSTEVDR